MHSRILLLTAVVVTLLFPALGWGQRGAETIPRFGDIRGQLRLPGGSPAPVGIAVTLIHREGDMVSQTQTDSSGKFSFVQMAPAIYRVKIRAHGYFDIESGDLDLNLSRMQYVSLDLRPDQTYSSANALPGGAISLESLSVPEAARKDLESGKALLEKGTDYPKSIEFFQKAIKAYPKYSEAYLMMGLAYRAQQNLDQAAAAFAKCVEINAGAGPAYTALGEVQNQKQEYAQAEKNLLKAVQLNPDAPQPQVELARSYWALGRWQDAEPYAAKALTLSPDNSSAHLIMGNIDLRKRNGAGALQHFQEYLKLDPNGSMAPGVRDLVSKLEKALAQPQADK